MAAALTGSLDKKAGDIVGPLGSRGPVRHEPPVRPVKTFHREALPRLDPAEEIMIVDGEFSETGRVHARAGRVGGNQSQKMRSESLEHRVRTLNGNYPFATG